MFKFSIYTEFWLKKDLPEEDKCIFLFFNATIAIIITRDMKY